ncbi:tyrosinase [Granulicella pectinivorans]|uniref:Tyrosinase n=1 Tax=Granulicella pectinivorans TaxID=474950 RepID=A0A1I6M5T1_9BACT|nr:tyrosinase family protein [Granulicella pectinivorans]SFS11031.1 tyrosinase [Granulicella pectinivorans]
MAIAAVSLSFKQVLQLLEDVSHGDASAFAGLSLWTMTRQEFLNSTLGGLPLVSVAVKKSCCSSTPGGAVASALVLGLKGEFPFDQSQYPRLPWGKSAMKAEEIALIEAWIADGAPEDAPIGQEYVVGRGDWSADQVRVRVEPSAYADAGAAYAEYQGATNEYKYQNGELRQRMNIDCMSEDQIERLRYAFGELYALNDWPDDARNYNNVALIHQNHCQHGWERFLPWHRVYLYELEQVIQDICPDVTLPYWDFTMPQYVPARPAEGEIIPPALKAFLRKESLPFLADHGIPVDGLEPLVGERFARQTDFFDAVGGAIGAQYTTGVARERFIDALLAANPLWYPLRYPGQFKGQTINKQIHYHYPTADDMAQILSLRSFRDFGGGSSYDDAFGFLDQNPHNTMHIWTGGMNPQAKEDAGDTKDRNKSVRVAGRRFHKKSDLYSQPALGDMFSNLTASYDPIFWCIHVNIDRIWHEWQELNPSGLPADLDSVLTPWSYTIHDTLEMRRFGYEYVKSTCLLPVGAASPVARFVSKPLEIAPTVRGSFRSAEVRLHRVPQLPRSGFVRVFLNLPDANANTPIDHANYAGYLAIFGHGDCIGGPGHCAVPQRSRYDLRPRSHNAPRNHRVNVTACARRLFDAGASSIAITLVVIGADYEEDRELLRMDGVSLNFLD